MGVLRSFGVVIVAILLFVSLLLLGTFATLSSSLNYDVVSPQIKPLIKDTINLTPIYDYEDVMNDSCINQTNFVYNDSNYSFVIPCEVVANGTEAILDYQIDSLIYDNYYKNYTCKFWSCFKETGGPFFLVSQTAKDYWDSKFNRFLFFSIVLAGLLFLLVKKKVNFPILTGVLLILSFIPIANLDSIGKFIVKLIFSSMKRAVSGINSIDLNSFSSIFFSQANSVFLYGLTVGLILIGLGVFLKLFKTGFKVGKLFVKSEKKKEERDNAKKD